MAWVRVFRNPLYHWTHLELRRYFGNKGEEEPGEIRLALMLEISSNRATHRGSQESHIACRKNQREQTNETAGSRPRHLLSKKFSIVAYSRFCVSMGTQDNSKLIFSYLNNLKLLQC